jgi:hypothetical protein
MVQYLLSIIGSSRPETLLSEVPHIKSGHLGVMVKGREKRFNAALAHCGKRQSEHFSPSVEHRHELLFK